MWVLHLSAICSAATPLYAILCQVTISWQALTDSHDPPGKCRATKWALQQSATCSAATPQCTPLCQATIL